MGYNTVVVLYNDQQGRWEDRLLLAAREVGFNGAPRCFGYGMVLSCDHADALQVVVVGRNTGKRISATDQASQPDLDALSEVLRGHGYTVRKPGRKRGDGSLPWGYAAQQQSQEGE